MTAFRPDQIVQARDLQRNIGGVLKQVEAHGPLLVLKHGKPAAVLSAAEGDGADHLATFHRRQYVKSEQKFDAVVGMLLRGEKVCIRCWQPKSCHVPGPPSPPETKGHLGATEDKPFICNDFLELTRERWEAGDGTGTAS